MKYSRLGRTSMYVSNVSLGGASFCNFYGNHDEASSIDLIRTAMANGINYIDTGPWYGNGTSELMIGKALACMPRDMFYIGCKVGRYEPEVTKMFDFSAERTHASQELSLQRMGLNYVDIIQVHDPTFAPDISVIIRETLPQLAKEVEAGRARYIGLADYDLDLMKEIIEESEIPISSILSYARATIIDNTLFGFNDWFQRKGAGIINASINAMGLLTNNGPMPWHPAPQEVKQLCRQAGQHCQENNMELARMSQWFTLNQPNIATHVLGVQNQAQLREAIDILINGIRDEEISVLNDLQNTFFKGGYMNWNKLELEEYKAKMARAAELAYFKEIQERGLLLERHELMH